jgi:hypothetical protein
VSRQSDAKKARRRKRQAARDATWIAAPVDDELFDDGEADEISEAVSRIDEWMTDRGWVLDTENLADVVSWVYAPSAEEFEDPDLEPVTRVWITVEEDHDEVVLEFGAALVGFGGDDEAYVLNPDSLADDVAALEAYRAGTARPELG